MAREFGPIGRQRGYESYDMGLRIRGPIAERGNRIRKPDEESILPTPWNSLDTLDEGEIIEITHNDVDVLL